MSIFFVICFCCLIQLFVIWFILQIHTYSTYKNKKHLLLNLTQSREKNTQKRYWFGLETTTTKNFVINNRRKFLYKN